MTAGHWWEPGNRNKSLPGVLLEDEEHGWVLHLDGSFEEINFDALASAGKPVAIPVRLPGTFPILVGTTSQGKLISLVDCQVLGGSPNLLGSRGSLRLWPTVVVYGVHFEGASDFRLTSLSVRYSHLDAWAATSGFSVRYATNIYPVEVTYAKPEAVDGVLSGGLKISIEFWASGPSLPALTNLSIDQQCWLTITSTVDLPFKKLLEDITDFANLISLGVGEPLRPLAMSATCNAQDPSGSPVTASLELIHNRKPIAPTSREVRHREMLFILPHVRARFSELMATWFGRDEAFRSLCALYFGTARSPSMYVEHRFLNMFQALESYDRRTFTPAPEKMTAHQERLDRILKAVDTSDQKWLKNQLRHSHEPAAADRIQRLVDKLDASWLLSRDDISLAADFRNYYTHFDPKVNQRLPALDKRFLIMHNLAVRLRVLCELLLLDAMGFSRDEVRERMKSTQRLARHLVDVTDDG